MNPYEPPKGEIGLAPKVSNPDRYIRAAWLVFYIGVIITGIITIICTLN